MNEENLGRAIRFIETWIDSNFPFARIPGLVVAIQKGDTVLLQKAWGMANVEKGIPMETSNLFRIASHSKLFTAVALTQLRERGKLSFDDLMVEHLPWLVDAKDKRYQTLTLRNVMEHSAGIIRDGNDASYWDLERPFPTKEELKNEIKNTKLVFEPNERFKYSNYGFSLLGLVLEEVSGLSYSEYIQKHILIPLKMDDTGTDVSKEVDAVRFATGYSRENRDLTRDPLSNPLVGGMDAATGVYSSVGDICKFARIFYSQNEVLSVAGRREITRMRWNTDENELTRLYGMGCDRRKIGSRWYVGHGGGFPGFITRTVIDIENQISVIVLRNSLDGPSISDNLLKILQFFETVKVTASSKEADIYEGTYEHLWATFDIVNRGDRLISFNPLGWNVPEEAAELKRIRTDEYVIERAGGFFAPGEIVKFIRKNNKIQSVIYAGAKASRIS